MRSSARSWRRRDEPLICGGQLVPAFGGLSRFATGHQRDIDPGLPWNREFFHFVTSTCPRRVGSRQCACVDWQRPTAMGRGVANIERTTERRWRQCRSYETSELQCSCRRRSRHVCGSRIHRLAYSFSLRRSRSLVRTTSRRAVARGVHASHRRIRSRGCGRNVDSQR